MLLRQRFPKLKVQLREGYRPQLEEWLLRQEIDLAITAVEGKPPAPIRTEKLIELPLALIVARSNPLKSAAELWKRDRIETPLIALPAAEAICRHFQTCLAQQKTDWFTSLEVSSLGLVETYAGNGFGIGLGLYVPKVQQSTAVRMIQLTEFPPVLIGMMWTGRRTALMDAFTTECHARAAFLQAS